jgi:cystathionine beta-lyase
MKTSTRCVHSGTRIDETTWGINTPIFTSSAYQYLGTESRFYPRYFNTPNQRAVIEKLADLEHCEDGTLFSSGMAAISTAMMTFLKPGDHAIIQDDIYGGSHTLVTDILLKRGIDVTFAPADADSIIAGLRPTTKLVYIESPTNPLLKIVDIKKVADFFRSQGILTAIDNTFASPINQNPSDLGIDIVLHSGTKYLGGHSDLCCGAALGKRELISQIADTAMSLGGSLNSESCYLLERSMKTLALRVERQTENAGSIAAFLASHPMIAAVHYPGLPTSPGYAVAQSQMAGFGAMLSFELNVQAGSAREFMGRLHLIKAALSLGGVETTICDPATTSHRKIPEDVRKRLGISDGLLRLSVGIEDCDDLIAELSAALDQKL